MAHFIPNTFSSYQLNVDEQKEASKLTSLQAMQIQNQISAYAQDVVNIKLDVANTNGYIQELAYKQGAIDALQYLLNLSEAANN